ncbi:MAG: adenylate/guanylate cyclase domain-containing protein [Bacteroidetes bacterium]|nr:adenylate/guanylate cyclase domain-containing protein [Bacteroidota bacterium]
MTEFLKVHNTGKINSGQEPWEIKIGIHSGPVIAGVIGRKKFAYDIWGDTVNVAARLVQEGEKGKVNISGTTFIQIRNNQLKYSSYGQQRNDKNNSICRKDHKQASKRFMDRHDL